MVVFKKIFGVFLVFLLLSGVVFASDVLKDYQNMLSKLNKSNPDYNIQKTLIYSIINILQNSNSYKLTLPKKAKNQDQFLDQIEKLAVWKVKIQNLTNQEKLIRDKLEALSKMSLDNNTTHKLQYAFYNLSLKEMKNDIGYLEKYTKDYQNKLYKDFLNIEFSADGIEKDIDEQLARYKKLTNAIYKLVVEKDRFVLLQNPNGLNLIQEKIQKLKDKEDDVAFEIFDDYLTIYFARLKGKECTRDIKEKLKKWSKIFYNPNYKALSIEKLNVAEDFKLKYIGKGNLFVRNVFHWLSAAILAVISFMFKPIFTVGGSSFSVFGFFIAVTVFVFGIYLGRIFKRKIIFSNLSQNLPVSTRTIISNIGYYLIVLIGFFTALRILGINLSSLTVIIGALSVGIGFGLQTMVANFIAGITLMLENSIRVGDYIEVNENIRGVVDDIKMRSTIITTNDGIEVILPNQTLFQSNVINWTLTEKIRRFRIPFSVAYGSDIGKMIEVLYDALNKSNLNFIRNDPKKPLEIKMIAMGSSSLDFNLDVWVYGDDVVYSRRTESKFLIFIYKTLNENGFVIPFPQLDLHVKEPVVIKKDV